NHQCAHDHEPGSPETGAHDLFVGSIEPVLKSAENADYKIRFRMRFAGKIRRKHGRNRHCIKERNHHRKTNRKTKLLEELPDDSGQKADWKKYCKHRGRGRNNCKCNLACTKFSSLY